MELPEVLYYAALEEDAAAIMESGRILPDEHGLVLLSDKQNAGIPGLVVKGHEHIALFRIDLQGLESDKFEQMSISPWYLYRGEVIGAEFIEFYRPPPDVAAAMRELSGEIEKLLSTLPPDKRIAFLQLLKAKLASGELMLDQATVDAVAGSLLADVDLDFGEEDA